MKFKTGNSSDRKTRKKIQARKQEKWQKSELDFKTVSIVKISQSQDIHRFPGFGMHELVQQQTRKTPKNNSVGNLLVLHSWALSKRRKLTDLTGLY